MRKTALSVSCALAVLTLLLVWAPSSGEPGPHLAVARIEEVVSNGSMSGLLGFPLGPDEVLVEVPEASVTLLSARGVRSLGPRGTAPLWSSPSRVPGEVLDAAGVRLVVRSGAVTLFSGDINSAYRVLESGYSMSRVKFTPVSFLTATPRGKELLERLTAERPLTPERLRFMRATAEMASPDSVEKITYFLNYDAAAGEYRSRFCARYDLKQDVTPYLRQRFEKYITPAGGTVWEQEFTPELPDHYKQQDTVFVNVVADLPGTRTSARYIICGHYDAIGVHEPGWEWTTDSAPGADDNGSGVTTVLECARILAGHEFDFGITFALWSAEEIGLLGSTYYTRNLAENDTIIGVINIDMVGYTAGDKWVEIVYGWQDAWLTEALQETADSLGLETELVERFRPTTHNSDHAPFWWQGIPGLMLGSQTKGYVPDPLTPYYHTLADTLGNVNLDQVTDNVRLVAGFMSRFADIPGDSLSDLDVTPASIEFDWDGRAVDDPMVAGDDLTLLVRALNVGGATDGSQTYEFKIWQGEGESGPLIHESQVEIDVVSGGTAVASATWKTSSGFYGDMTFTASLLPVEQDVESDITNNEASGTVTISPTNTILENLHIYPNPTGDPGQATIAGDIYTSQTNFLAGYVVEVFDVTGLRLLRGEGQTDERELEIPISSLAGNASGLAPGLYVCILRMDVRDEAADITATTKFAVVSGSR